MPEVLQKLSTISAAPSRLSYLTKWSYYGVLEIMY